jgi:hypothetical protein
MRLGSAGVLRMMTRSVVVVPAERRAKWAVPFVPGMGSRVVRFADSVMAEVGT